MGRLRVLHIIHTLEFAGAQRYVADLVCAPTDEVEWLVVGLAPPESLVPELKAKGLPLVKVLAGSRRDPRLPGMIREIIAGEQVDVVHAHGIIPPFWTMLAMRGMDIPLVVGVNSQPSKVRWMARALMRPIVFRRADVIVCASRAVRDELARMYPAAAAKATVIYNCVDSDRLRVKKGREQVRAEIGVGEDVPLVCNVANIWWVKGHVYLVRAMAKVVQRLPEAQAIVAGAVSDKQAAAQVERELDRLDMRDRVRFLGRRSDVPDLVAASDVFVLSSVTECLPVSIIEAMLIGTPVVATDVGGVSELVIDGQTGFLVPPADPDALADAIVAMAENPGLRQQMSQAAGQHVRDLTSVEKVRAAHIELYTRLLARQPVAFAS